MATELSRTFDIPTASVIVKIQDALGTVSTHTIYLAGVSDVNATVAQLLTDTEAACNALKAKLAAAGWVPQSGS